MTYRIWFEKIHRINGNIQLFPQKKCLWKEVQCLKTTPMCHGEHICSVQAQPNSAGVKVPVVHTKWWKWRQIIFWKVPIFPNFVNSACMKISFAFSALSCCIWNFIKVKKMNNENCFLCKQQSNKMTMLSSHHF